MGVYIKGMEMPQDYAVVVKIFPDGSVGTIPYIQFFKVDLIEGAQAVPVPPHGDLIDRDALRDNNCDVFEINGVDGAILAMDVSIIDDATVIIPASE